MNEHTKNLSERVIRKVQEGGSGSTSVGGAVKWLKKHRHAVHPLPLPGDVEFLAKSGGIGAYKFKEALRVADSEIKRAKHDSKYRRNWLRRLLDEERRLLAPNSLKTIVEITEAYRKYSSTNSRLQDIQNTIRKISTLSKHEVKQLPEFNPENAFLISSNEDWKNFGWEPPRAKRRWRTQEGWVTEVLCDQDFESHYKGNGRWVTDCNAEHRDTFRCFSVISNTRQLECAIGSREFCLTLPDGYHWNKDVNGIRAVYGPDDFHPQIGDLWKENAVEEIVRRLQENAQRRKLLAAQEAATKAEAEGVYVCVADSLRAGNCLAGTKSFAQRHGLDTRKHYHAPDLLEMANGDGSRVKLTITSAVIRHHQEMERGYATLEEHLLTA
jgi:hypothetical protein